MFDVVSIGAATTDIFIASSSINLQNNNLVLPSSSKNEIDSSLICSGGGATNSAVSFSRLGLKSGCISLLGRDPLSSYVLADLKLDSVTPFLTQAKEPTDFSVIIIGSDGGRTVLTNRGLTRLESKLIPWSKIKKPAWFYITSLEGNINLLEKIIGYALENHIRISLNPGNRELLQKKLLLPLLSHVDFLLLNKAESELLTSTDISNSSYWPKLISTGAKIIAVTHGRDGAYVTDGSSHLYSPIRNTSPVDETGAGDSFGSAFVSGLFYRHSLEKCLSWAIHNSASVVSRLGSKPGLLKLSQINKS